MRKRRPWRASKASFISETAFTLVELLVVIAIIAVLISILMPVITAVKRRAETIQCASNMRQIGIALMAYAADNRKGVFPPNLTTPLPGRFWCDVDRIGRYLRTSEPAAVQVRGPVFTCPADTGGARSYSMNIWVSSDVDLSVKQLPTGRLWSPGEPMSSSIILLAEKWSTVGSDKLGWTSEPIIGKIGETTPQRFGADGGLNPNWMTMRFKGLNSELPFMRHRTSGGGGKEPKGRVNFFYADGHVATVSEADLINPVTELSTYHSLWSLADDEINIVKRR